MLKKLTAVFVMAAMLAGCAQSTFAGTVTVDRDTVFENGIFNNDPATEYTLIFSKPVRADVKGSLITDLTDPENYFIYGVWGYSEPGQSDWTPLSGSSLFADGDVVMNIRNNIGNLLNISGAYIPYGILDVRGILKNTATGSGDLSAFGITNDNYTPNTIQDIRLGGIDINVDSADDALSGGLFQNFHYENTDMRIAINGAASVSALSHTGDSEAKGINFYSTDIDVEHTEPTSTMKLTVSGPISASAVAKAGSASSLGFSNYNTDVPSTLRGIVDVKLSDVNASAIGGNEAKSTAVRLIGNKNKGNGRFTINAGNIVSYAEETSSEKTQNGAESKAVYYEGLLDTNTPHYASFGSLASKAVSPKSSASAAALDIIPGTIGDETGSTLENFFVNGDINVTALSDNRSSAHAVQITHPANLYIGSPAKPVNINVTAASIGSIPKNRIANAVGMILGGNTKEEYEPFSVVMNGGINVKASAGTFMTNTYAVDICNDAKMHYLMNGNINVSADIASPSFPSAIYGINNGVNSNGGKSDAVVNGNLTVKTESSGMAEVSGANAKGSGNSITVRNIYIKTPADIKATPIGISVKKGASVQADNVALTTGTAVDMDSRSNVKVLGGMTADDAFAADPAVSIKVDPLSANQGSGLLFVGGTVGAGGGTTLNIDGSSFSMLQDLKNALPQIIIGKTDSKDADSIVSGTLGNRPLTSAEAADIRKNSIQYTVGYSKGDHYKVNLDTANLSYFQPEDCYLAKEGDRVDFNISTDRGYVVGDVDCGSAEAVKTGDDEYYYVTVPTGGGVYIQVKVRKTVYAALWKYYFYGMDPESKERTLWLCTKVDHGRAKLMCVYGFEKTPDGFIEEYCSKEEQGNILSDGYYLDPELSEKLMGDGLEHPIIEVDLFYIGY